MQCPKCVPIVQAYGDQNEWLLILCEHSTIGLMVQYFDEARSTVLSKLCTTASKIEKIIKIFSIIYYANYYFSGTLYKSMFWTPRKCKRSKNQRFEPLKLV